MGHNINAVLGKQPQIESMHREIKVGTVETKGVGFSVLLLDESAFDSLTAEDNSPDPYTQFRFLSAPIYNMLFKVGSKAEIAYIETNYFGGVGSQAALLIRHGEIVGPFATEDTWEKNTNEYTQNPLGQRAINHVLNLMGVSKTSKKDEFAIVGLETTRGY